MSPQVILSSLTLPGSACPSSYTLHSLDFRLLSRMFARATFLISLALLLVGQTQAVPLSGKSSNIIARSAEPISIIERQIPADVAVKAPDGKIIPYSKREEEELLRRVIPEEVPVKAINGDIVPYKREEEGPAKRDNAIPAEIAVKSTNGVIEPYSKREEEELARRGIVVSYTERDLAADSRDLGRRYISPEIPTRSLNGVIELYN